MITPRDGIARPLFRALVVLGLVAGGVAGWIALAPISGAVIAEGRFKVDGDVKTVQHLDGGVVAEIAVRDGDRVQQGDLLLKLDATDAEAALGALEAERDSLVARQLRLEAERDDLAEPDFASLGDRTSDSLRSAIANQAVLFTARQAELAAQTEVLDGTINRLSARLAAQRAELRSVEAQLVLAEDDAETARNLEKSQMVTRRELNNRERELASLSGSRDALHAAIAETEAAQTEARLSHARSRTQYLSAVSSELSEVVAELAGIDPQIAAERQRIARTRVTAPVSGVVFGLTFGTIGGVVGAGEPILEILPADGTLVAEARLQPDARERLRVGMPVELRLPGVRSRQENGFPGRIELISAELTADPEARGEGQEPTYAVRIALAEVPENLHLEPGMPVTSVIPTDARTAFDYLISPLSDAMARSMRED